MKITIVTPSYNRPEYLERTIKSVLSQNDVSFEYIIMDGGSDDATISIIKKYEHDPVWQSKKDNGQTHAINKGFNIGTGDIIGYLNSDDTYEPSCLKKVIDYFEHNPDKKWLCGKSKIIDENDLEIRAPITWYKNFLLKRYSYQKLLTENFIQQPSTFWRRDLFDEIGSLNEGEHFCMDYEYWLRIGKKYEPGITNTHLANFRCHKNSKSGALNRKQFRDELRIAKKYGADHPLSILLHYINYYKIIYAYKFLDSTERGMKIIKNSYARK